MDDETERLVDINIDSDLDDGEGRPPCWRALLYFTSASHILPLFFALFFSISAGFVIPLMSIYMGKIFDRFSDFGAGHLGGKELVEGVYSNSLVLCGLGGASGVLNGAFYGSWLIFGELQAKSAREQIFDGMLAKDLSWYDRHDSKVEALVLRIQSYVKDLQLANSQPLGFTIQSIATALAALTLSFYHAWSLTLVSLAAVPFSVVALAWISGSIQPAVEAYDHFLTNATKRVANAISSIETVKCFNGQDHEILQYIKAVKMASRSFLVQAQANALQFGLMRLLTLGIFVQGFWYGSHLVEKGSTSTGNVVTAFMAALVAAQSIEQMLPQLLVLEKGRAAGVALQGIQTKIKRGRKIGSSPGTKRLPPMRGEVELQNVTFSYPSRPNHPALKQTSISFPPGKTSFVLGKSGSGKSTLGNLLAGLYHPCSGNVLLDGQPIQALEAVWLRKNVTLVQQNSVLFNETLLTNVALGRTHYNFVRREEVKNSINFAELRAFAESLPRGLDTMIGLGGMSLSGGQSQRVALARAHIRDAPLLILDEATNALDHINRILVMHAIRKWRKGKTTIVLTHELEQIYEDDHVYVLEGGCLMDSGRKSELSISNSIMPALRTIQTDRLPDRPYVTANHSSPSLCNRGIQLNDDQHDWTMNETSLKRKRRLVPSPLLSGSKLSSPMSSFSRSTSPISYISPTVSPAYHRSRNLSPCHSPGRYKNTASLAEPIELPHIDLRQPRKVKPRRATALSPTFASKARWPPKFSRWRKRISSTTDAFREVTETTIQRSVMMKAILGTVWPSLSFHQRIVLLVGFTAAFIHGAATPIFSWAFSKLLGSMIINSGRGHSNEARMWSFAILSISIADALASYCMHYMLEFCSQRWVDAIRTQAFQRIMVQPCAWFNVETHSLVRLTESLDRDAEEMRNLLGRFAGFFFVAITMMTMSTVWGMTLNWKLTCIGLALAPIMYAVTQAFEGVSEKWESKSDEAATKVSDIFNETFSNIRTVKILTLEPYFHAKCFNACRAGFQIGLKRSLFAGILFGISDSAILFIIALILWSGAQLAAKEPKTLQDILTALTMMLFGISNLNAIIAFIPQISSSRATACRLLELSRLPYRKSHEHTGHSRIASPGLISLRSVTFAYPSQPAIPALVNLTLNIQSSRSTALVGRSGSGKSTIASILMGLYPPSSGSLTIDNISFRNIHLSTLRCLFAIVPQKPTIFPGTVWENIAYAHPVSSSLDSMTFVRRAAKAAGLDEFIMTLPQGYSTLIGPGGTGLSGGQQQRIAIARAITRRPKFLILDEATSALDNVTADAVRKLVRRLQKQGVGVLAITHDRAMMESCQEVVVMKDRRVVEHGSYRTLMMEKTSELRKLLGG